MGGMQGGGGGQLLADYHPHPAWFFHSCCIPLSLWRDTTLYPMDTADTAALEADAKSRLIALLSYCREISTLHRKDAAPVWALRGCMGGDDASAAVLHEGLLRRLQELTTEGGVPMLWLGDGDAESSPGCGAWMRLRRPDAEGARQSPVGQLVCQVYSALFGAHQEALREGRGAQVCGLSPSACRLPPPPPPHTAHCLKGTGSEGAL